MAVRSRVLLHRTPQGVKGVLPPQDVLAASHLHSEAVAAASLSVGGKVYKKSSHLVGIGEARVPIELVAPLRSSPARGHRRQPRAQERLPSPGGQHTAPPSAPPAAAGAPAIGAPSGTGPGLGTGAVPMFCSASGEMMPELTSELREELRERFASLQALCHTDFNAHPRTLKYFFGHLQECCEFLQAQLGERTYRDGHSTHALHHFVQLLPQIKDHADLPAVGSELPKAGWLTLTMLLALGDVPWEFKYNSLQHRVCNCRTVAGYDGCVAPVCEGAGGVAAPSARWPTSGGKDTPRPTIGGWCGSNVGASTGVGTAGKPEMGVRSRMRLEEAKIGAIRRRERHFPQRIVELSIALRSRFKEFLAQIPTFVEELRLMPEHLAASPLSHSRQQWTRFCEQFRAEVTVLDRAYGNFEKLALGVVSGLIGTALAPVQRMTGPSGVITHRFDDPFREVQTAVLCQRLGLLKRQVNFGGPHNLVHFDPGLLVKARRLVQMGAYSELCNLAERMLLKFDELCKVLVDIKIDHIRPELAENTELRTAVLGLEEVWAECQFLLQQEALDFIRDLLDFLRGGGLDEFPRWQLRVGLLTSDAAANEGATEVRYARVTLFETLPILMYLDEVWRDIAWQKESGEPGTICRYRELFCPKDDRHHTLRRDFSKFDELRFRKFRAFLLGDATEDAIDRGQMRYFGMLHRQLKEVAAFTPEDPQRVIWAATAPGEDENASILEGVPMSKAATKEAKRKKLAQEAHARWVCVQRVAQTVEPRLFPKKRPRTPDGVKLARRQDMERRQSSVRKSSSAIKAARFLNAAVANKEGSEMRPVPSTLSLGGASSEGSASPGFDEATTTPLSRSGRTTVGGPAASATPREARATPRRQAGVDAKRQTCM